MAIGDYYKILKVNRDATGEDLKKSYRNLSTKLIQEKNHQEPLRKQMFETEFKKISEAYDVLTDPKKRKIYDLYGQYPVKMTRNLTFGVVERSLECTLEELYNGCRKKVNIIRTVPDEFGNLKSVQETLKIDVQPGWKKGTKITFPGKGNQKPGSLPSDLILVVNERPHALFRRDGNDLTITLKLSLLEALIGKTLNMKTLDGRDITIQVTDPVTPGYVKTVSNEGMPLARDPSKKGILRIKFDVVFPSMLTTQQKDDVRRILIDATDS